MINYYKELLISQDLDISGVEKALDFLVSRYNLYLNNEEFAEETRLLERLALVEEARSVLLDIDKKSEYDNQLSKQRFIITNYVDDISRFQDTFTASFDEATKLLQDNSLEQALLHAKHTVINRVNDPKAFELLGDIYAAMQDYEKSLKSYGEAICLIPLHEAYITRTYTTRLIKEIYDKAVVVYNEAMSTGKDQDLYYPLLSVSFDKMSEILQSQQSGSNALDLSIRFALMADMHRDAGNDELAVQAYKKALQITPENSYYYAMIADINEKNENIEEAISYYVLALEHDSEVAYYSTRIADLYRKLNQSDGELNALRKALAIDKQNSLYHGLIGNYYIRHNEFKKAQSAYLKACSLSKDNDIYHYCLGQVYLGNESNEAISLLQRATEIDETYSPYHFDLGVAYYSNKQFEEAANEFVSAENYTSNMHAYNANLASAYYQLQDYKKALRHIKTAIFLSDNYEQYYDLYANVLVKLGKYEEAVKAYNNAISINGRASYYSNLSVALFALKKYEEASEAVLKAMELGNRNSELIKAYGYLQFIQHIYKTAITYFEEYSNSIQEEDVLYSLAKSYQAIGDKDNYARTLSRLVMLFPNYSYCYEGAEAYKDINQYSEAINLYHRASSYFKYNDQLHYQLGISYISIFDYYSAIEPLQFAAKLDNKNPLYFFYLGKSYHEIENYNGAINALMHADELEPNNPVTVSTLADAYFKTANYADAIGWYKQAIKFNDTEPSYHYRLGLSFEKTDDFKGAKNAYSNAINLRNDDDKYLYHLGYVNNKLNIPYEAIDALKKAIAINKDDIEYYYELATSYDRVQDYLAEANTYTQISRLNPSYDNYMTVGNLAIKGQDYNLAAQGYLSATTYNRDNEVLGLLANAYTQAGRYPEAVDIYREMISKQEQPETVHKLGRVYYLNNQYHESLAEFNRAIALDGTNPIYYSDLALSSIQIAKSLQESSDYDAVVEMLDKRG